MQHSPPCKGRTGAGTAPERIRDTMNALTTMNTTAPGVMITAPAAGFSSNLFERFADYADVNETTLKGYTSNLKQFALWLTGQGITAPQREDIKAYKQHLESRGFTAGTQAQYLRAVKQFFKWTASEGLYPNIADNIKGAKVKQDNTRKEAFDEQGIITILDSIDTTTEQGSRDYAMILLSVTAALRIIEMQRADIQDIQTVNGQKRLYIQGKGHHEKDDYVKIVPEVWEAIENYLSFRRDWKKTDPLFASTGNRSRGGRLAEPSISRIIKAEFIGAGFDCSKLTAHSLRHTSNTLLFKAGADLYTAQHHARHLDPKTTEIYLHSLEKEKAHTEQDVYNQIFKPGQQTPQEEALDLLNSLTPEEMKRFLPMLRANVALIKATSEDYEEAPAMAAGM